MKPKIKTLLRGAGSLIDIFPRPEFRSRIARKNATERMSEHWQRVGESFRRVLADFPHEQNSGQDSSSPAR